MLTFIKNAKLNQIKNNTVYEIDELWRWRAN